MNISPAEKKLHAAHGAKSLSLMAKDEDENVFDTSRESLGAHEVPFPRKNLRIGEMAPHMAITGASGAGKTLLLKGFMLAILPADLKAGGLRYRAMIYDPKRELYPFLRAAAIPEEQIIITHPFDVRSAAWDLAADFTEPAQITELSEMLIPKRDTPSNDGSEFFEKTSRIIIQDIVRGLIAACGSNWDLRDILEAALEPAYAGQILKKTAGGTRTWKAYFYSAGTDQRFLESIRASLHTALNPFQTLAAVWHQSSTKFSLAKWQAGSGILLMGADPEREATIQQVNQLLFHRASQLLLARNEENPVDLTWFFLDEVREAGKLSGLRQLLTQGRSKGARVVIGFQDIDGLTDLYGEKAAEELIGLCANRIFLHLDNPSTRNWVSEFFAEEEKNIVQKTRGGGASGYSWSDSTEVGTIVNVLPVELHDLPLASAKHGVYGFFAIPPRHRTSYTDGRPQGERGPFHLTPASIAHVVATGLREDSKAFDPRPESDQNYILWSENDFERLGIKPLEVPEIPEWDRKVSLADAGKDERG